MSILSCPNCGHREFVELDDETSQCTGCSKKHRFDALLDYWLNKPPRQIDPIKNTESLIT